MQQHPTSTDWCDVTRRRRRRRRRRGKRKGVVWSLKHR
jgi:hypothetical protein